MPALIRRMPNGQGIAAGQTATFNLPLGMTYDQLIIRMVAASADVPVASWATYVGEVRLIVDGDVKVRAQAADLVSLAQYHGQVLTAGVLPIFLSRPWQRSVQGEDFPGYGTADVQSMTLEIDIVAAITLNSLVVYAKQTANAKLGQHFTLRQYSIPVSVTGTREVSELPKGDYGMIAMHLSTANVTDWQVLANMQEIQKMDRAVAAAYARQYDNVAQSGWTHIDFAANQRLADILPMQLQDFRVRFEMSGTGAFRLLCEQIEGRNA